MRVEDTSKPSLVLVLYLTNSNIGGFCPGEYGNEGNNPHDPHGSVVSAYRAWLDGTDEINDSNHTNDISSISHKRFKPGPSTDFIDGLGNRLLELEVKFCILPNEPPEDSPGNDEKDKVGHNSIPRRADKAKPERE